MQMQDEIMLSMFNHAMLVCLARFAIHTIAWLLINISININISCRQSCANRDTTRYSDAETGLENDKFIDPLQLWTVMDDYLD